MCHEMLCSSTEHVVIEEDAFVKYDSGCVVILPPSFSFAFFFFFSFSFSFSSYSSSCYHYTAAIISSFESSRHPRRTMLRGGLGEQPPGDPAPRRGPCLRNGFETTVKRGETHPWYPVPRHFWRAEGPPVLKEMEWSWTYNSKPLKCGKTFGSDLALQLEMFSSLMGNISISICKWWVVDC